MIRYSAAFLTVFIGISAALPADPVIRKLDPNLRFKYETNGSGKNVLVDTWMKLSDLAATARFNPIVTNSYNLFTRQNPSTSQNLLFNNVPNLLASNFDSSKRTIVLLHTWQTEVISDFSIALVPALLAAADVNVILVDWTAGSNTINYPALLDNTVKSGRAVATFINWLNQITGSLPSQFHIIGHGFGGHQAGVAARYVQGEVGYITALDPAFFGWINHNYRLQPEDSAYTEVIHTNSGINGYLGVLGHVDFYPNGGESMPGCETHNCDHARSFYYFAESIISGGFTGRQCSNFLSAVFGICSLPGSLQMGGLTPKTGQSGVYYLVTNAAAPFSRG